MIRNGRVLDGAGNPWINADVAIKDGRFVRIGVVNGKGAREIDASGKYVSPGWIDAMDQSGEVLLRSGLAENKLRMGVTTSVGGEGGTPVPSAEISDYFAQLEGQGISMNFATFYSATQARYEVIGDVARTPTPEEIQSMRGHVEEAMEAGALGLATALIYPPGSYQTTDELVEIVSASAPYGGIYATHMRDEGRDLIPGIEEAIEIGERAGVRVEIFHLKAAYSPGWGTLMREAGQVIEAARERGVDIAADMYPYVAGGSGLEITLPLEVYEDGLEEGYEKLRDLDYRRELISRIYAQDFGEWHETNLVAASGSWDNVVLANAQGEPFQQYVNLSIGDIASELGREPYDLVIDIMVNAHPDRALAYYFMMSEEDVRTALQFPWTSIGSDAAASEVFGEVDSLGLPHPRAYGTFPRIIAKYVRDDGVLTLEEAVRKMTSWPAFRYGLKGRGVIQTGSWADVTIFDYDEIKDGATFEDGLAAPSGIEYVIVNGVISLENDQHTGARAGMVIRGAGANRD